MGRLAFGDFEIDFDRFELRCDGAPRHLEPQVFEVLAYLARHPDRVISKEELLDQVWGDRFVSESALTSRIRAARAALDDNGRDQRLIKTVYGRGYRFMSEVTELDGGTGGREGPVPGSHGSDIEAVPTGHPLLERERELDTIERFVVELRDDHHGGVVCISGNAGLGKTTLTRRAMELLGGGVPVLLGYCEDLTTPRPLGPFRDMLLPGGRPLIDPGAAVSDPSSALLALRQVVADHDPPVIVLEDVHWADDATVDLLRIIVRQAPALPALVVMTYRDEDVGIGHPMRRLLGSLRPPVAHLALQPFSVHAIEQLSTGTCLPAEQVLSVTGGNPFFVSEIVANPDHPVPATVRDAVLARLDMTSPAVRSAVQRLAVIPSRVERWLAEALVDDASEVLGEAERRGILDGDTTAVWFRHELARRAIESDLTAAEVIHHHARVMEVLIQRGDEPARIVHHAAASGDTGVLRTYALEAAGRAASAGAHRQAVAHLDRYLSSGDDLDATTVADAQVQRAHSLYLLNRFAESLGAAEDAVARWSSLDDDRRLATALSGLARTALWAIGPRAAEEAGHEALRAAERAHAPSDVLAAIHAELARACGNLATLGSVSEPSPRAVEHARIALRSAQDSGRDDLVAHALTYLGAERLSNGDAGGHDDLRRAVDMARTDPRVEFVARACVNASGAIFRAGRPEEALAYVATGLDACADGEFFAGEFRLQLTRAAVNLATGDWDSAARELRALIARPGEPGIMGPMAIALLARIQARKGDDEATMLVRLAVDAVEGSQEPHVVGPVAAAAAELHWLTGEGPLPDIVGRALTLSRDRHHLVTEGELGCYSARCGTPTDPPSGGVGPWEASGRGEHAEAAARWAGLGEQHEFAVESWAAGNSRKALDVLEGLGATATIEALRRHR